MKKILAVLVLIIVILCAAVYLFVPRNMQIRASVMINAASPGVFRSLSDDDSWKKFWPGSTPLKLGDYSYVLKERSYNLLIIDINNGKDTIKSTLTLIPIRPDQLEIQWNAERVNNTNNPLKRFALYKETSALEENMKAISDKIKEFMEQTKNIYGFDIKQTKVTDSVLISTKRLFNHQPDLKDIDDMIQSLKKYIAENGAIEKNSPMLNFFHRDSSQYEVMTAIPVDKELPLTKEFAPKFLLKGGYILEAEVRGGPYKIETGLKELESFRSDYKLDSPAIPYQLLITDRLKEQDTTKWVTRLYYPIL